MLELFVLSGQDLGEVVALGVGDAIGRGEGARLRLRDRSISRRHAVVEEREGQLVLVDAGSTNGLHLAGVRVPEVLLSDGVEFRAGDVELRARVDRALPPEAAVGAGVDPGAADRGRAPSTEPPAGVPQGADAARPAPGESSPSEGPAFSFGGGVAQPGRMDDDLELELDFDEPEEAPPAEAPAKTRTQVSNAERAKLLADLGERRTGFFSADLAQYPAWIQLIALLGVLAVFAGLVWGAFHLVVQSRGG